MHNRHSRDSDRCFRTNGFYGRTNSFTFVGDERIRQLYLHMRDLLGADNLTAWIEDVSWCKHLLQCVCPTCIILGLLYVIIVFSPLNTFLFQRMKATQEQIKTFSGKVQDKTCKLIFTGILRLTLQPLRYNVFYHRLYGL